MHDCQKFREEWIAGSAGDDTSCEQCRQFCEEAGMVLAALRSPSSFAPEVSEQYWISFDNRLRARLTEEQGLARQRVSHQRWAAAFTLAASIALAVTWGSLHIPGPVDDQTERADARIDFDTNHIEGLDRGVIDFLVTSEGFVRDFNKINPALQQDIEDARHRASRKLAGITQQKMAAAGFDPVLITLDEYESVLREIKNAESPEDIADIQMRIRRNGLIASLKAYQPQVVRVSQR